MDVHIKDVGTDNNSQRFVLESSELQRALKATAKSCYEHGSTHDLKSM